MVEQEASTLEADSEFGEPASPEARAAAWDLKSRYFFCVDNKQWAKLRSLFTDDAKFEGFSFGGDGPDGFVRGASKLLEGTRSVHHGAMPLIHARSDKLLRVRWSMFDFLTWPPGSRPFRGNTSPDLCGFRAYGYYEEEYSRTEKGWRISFMRLTRLRTEMLFGSDTGENHGALAPTLDWLP